MNFSRKTYLILTAVALLLLAAFLWLQRMGSGTLESRDTTGSQTTQDAAPNNNRPSRATPHEADRLLKTEGAKTDVTLTSFPIKEY